MSIHNDQLRLLQARIVCRSDAVVDEVRRVTEEKYVVRTVSYPQKQSQSHMAVVRQYMMTLPELVQWFDENRQHGQPEQTIRIRSKAEQKARDPPTRPTQNR